MMMNEKVVENFIVNEINYDNFPLASSEPSMVDFTDSLSLLDETHK